jgi:aspartyl/asparaginyl beta-hydroxylase (cupin superfamily)
MKIDADYWKRQLPNDALAKLAENGRACTDANGLPLEDSDPIPVVRLFMADGMAEWLLGYSYPKDPDRVFIMASQWGHGWEFGDVRISDLKKYRNTHGLPFERDRSFVGNRPLSEYMNT